MENKTPLKKIAPLIVYLRGKAVILDSDLARIYGVSTKAMNQAVKRNRARFPLDFMFQISRKDLEENRSQFVTGSKKHRDPRFRPFAFTEQGAIMAANVLNSVTASRMSVFVVRAFVKMRALLSNDRGLAEELKKLERKLTGRLDAHELAIVDVLRRLIKLLEPNPNLLRSTQNPRARSVSSHNLIKELSEPAFGITRLRHRRPSPSFPHRIECLLFQPFGKGKLCPRFRRTNWKRNFISKWTASLISYSMSNLRRLPPAGLRPWSRPGCVIS